MGRAMDHPGAIVGRAMDHRGSMTNHLVYCRDTQSVGLYDRSNSESCATAIDTRVSINCVE